MGRRYGISISEQNGRAMEMAMRPKSATDTAPSIAERALAVAQQGQFSFTVRSSEDGESYQIAAIRTAKGIRFTCTCQAGQNGLHCRHRVGILLRDPEACVDIEETTLDAFHEMVEGSALLAAVNAVQETNAAAEAAKREQQRAKKALARAMMG